MWCLQKAYHFLWFLLFFLNFQASFSSSSSSITQLCSIDEASALIQFKISFSLDGSVYCNEDIGVKSYPKTDSWKEDTDCCSWDGVTCDKTKGQVIGLDLNCSRLYGTITSDSSLFKLPHLRKLNLAFNNFNSSMMSYKFGEFPSLAYLNLSQSSFAGKVPSQISHLSKLVSLDLSWNYLQTFDTLTLKGLVHNLTELRQLFLDQIDMSSIDPNIFMNLSSSLRSLSLYFCGLQGNFPENIFHLPNLKMLNLGYNVNLNLSIPKTNRSNHLEFLGLSSVSLSTEFIDSISNLESLEHLDASEAVFSSGGLPNSIGNLTSLKYLELNGAYISGSLPDSIGNLISLKYLNLRASNISGSIPKALGNLLKLNFLHLSENSFTGQVPSSIIRNLTQLEFLNIGGNQLKGSIPDKVNAFPNLVYLSLDSNLLNGTLPSWLFTIPSLKYIYFSNNQFTGHIKEFQYQSLQVIDLSFNNFHGPIPSSISQLLNLTSLSLSSNNLTGIVEFGMFSKLQNLKLLHLSSNRLSLQSNGSSADYTLPNLQHLYLSSCNVSEFPHFLRGSKSLKFLDLSYNRIGGKIPKWMLDVGKDTLVYLNLSHNSLTDIEQLPWKNIDFLDLSSNLIHGDLPLPPLTTSIFFISNNSLSGDISPLICNVISLRFLDLSHNNLGGIIPQCFGTLSNSLSLLNLRMNKLLGVIPPTFEEGCQLKNLNLNGNQIEGHITRSVINCRDLEVLDLGNNKINDTFPHWLGSLSQLKVLVLRSNHLQGSMQDSCPGLSFSKIQIFDLSSNYFSGALPVRCITNFKSMINLTFNESAMRYMGMSDRGDDLFYSYSIGLVMKGVELELVKIFTMLTSIDLSNNKLDGEIPKVIGKLNSLKGLNLSHNNLAGCIPTSMGSLLNLEWLDLSSNKLTGMVPESLLDVTSLSFLNLSENQLVGCIPRGNQFNTFENSSYYGNEGLRGFPLSRDCSNKTKPPPSNLPEEDGSKSNITFGWKVVLIGYGCGVVFGLAVGYIVFRTGKPKWFVTLFEDRPHRRKTSKIGNRRTVGRRI
ncbi:hypothetical protein PTKIN_Ptkin14bG0229200 [Pterospermum kingtungense]